MKIKDIVFSKYEYKRICVVTHCGTEYYPENSEEAVVKVYGESEIDGELEVTETGWLSIRLPVDSNDREE